MACVTQESVNCINGTEDDSFAASVSDQQKQNEVRSKIWKVMKYVGPGFLVCIAYVDPGNFETDFQAGADYKFKLLWVLLWSTCASLFIQSLAANLGVTTGRHLAEHCKAEYNHNVNMCLWIAAEISIIASDVPEVLGTALALDLLFNIPVWIGVILTGVITLSFLGLQKFGARNLELFIAFLVFAMAICFFVELGFAKPPVIEVLKGLAIPSLAGSGATALTISFVGSIIMPHNLYLHSALVLSRKTSPTVQAIKEARFFCLLESGVALSVSLLINIAVISLSGTVCSNPSLSNEDKEKCSELNLNQASFLLGSILGSWSSTLFGITLIVSGQSSTITGTYAGQYVMQGFLNLRMSPWKRNLLTRCVAIVPSLIAALIGGARGAGSLIIVSSMVLSFELPFALIPLLKFTSDERKMGSHKNHLAITVATWMIGSLIILVNIYFLGETFYEWLRPKSAISLVGKVFIGIASFGALLAYLFAVLYLTFRKDKVKVSHAIALEVNENA
ncbi:hypothetical protein KP509_14G048600 [Ceratopteris richardii]|uniref:Uncharacterized protein n=1 Tax=Ceratopteris richardii TaxID=49495 RepID=A0A8T2T9H9_CERRI|nr:hypothetical protein KP509_14G048600 [Ceratopteris richardii]KAH7415500.1 hypothetical protein KP509_14G048600 [Ceratopteris richardii]KAH7415501.1 hypothetical protein KP509_14G048600 [Ceratopteris richardii]